ncbi:MAG: nucleotidyltransferase family protein, partial [Spirosomaceae bacterium]|nr:nucleotidyltransferase family protein [Spirosomataceae bacterium]
MTAKEAQKLLGIRDDQVLLLKAALYPPDEAIGYWQQWKKHWNLLPNSLLGGAGDRASFAQIDTESQRILPLVFRNLEHTQDPLLPALKETYRVTWMRNQRLLQKAQAVVKALNDANIPNMLLKGIPMSLHYYKDMGVRPMGDVDILVPYEYLDQVVEILKTLGNIPNPIEYKYRHLLHAMHCFDEGGIDVDLHWFVHYLQMNKKTEDEYWKHRIPFSLTDTIETSILAPHHQVFHNIIHG